MGSSSFSLICIFLAIGVVYHCSAIVLPTDDCTESGSHAYNSHSSRSSSYSSGYSGGRQHHPSPSGHQATSSQYIRTGSASTLPLSTYSSYGAAQNSGYKAGVLGTSEDDLQVASSQYSAGSKYSSGSNYERSSGGYGLHQPATLSYSSNQLENQNSGYGTSGSAVSSDTQVREKYETLKQKADAFVHNGAPPPVGSLSSQGYGSGVQSSAYESRVQSSQRYGSGSSNSGNILGVTYGATGVEEDNSQRLIPVPVTLPASSALVREKQESHVSYSSRGTSGTNSHADGVDYSISGNSQTPLPVSTSYGSQSGSTQFEELKHKAEAFVHGGAPPPTSQLSSSSLQQSGTHVEALPAKATDRGTIVVPVKVTITREQTVVPNGGVSQGGYYGNGDVQQSSSVVSSKKESYSSQLSSSAVVPQTVSYQSGSVGQTSGAVYSSIPTGESTYTYDSQVSKDTPSVYTVGPKGTVHFPTASEEEEERKRSGFSSSSYSKNVHRDSVVVPGAVLVDNPEEYEKKSNKLFDLVSGYGTFLPAKEESQVVVNPASNSVSSSSYSSSSHSSKSEGGYQTVGGGAAPVGSKTITTYYNSKSTAVPTHIAPGIPLGDPLTPPEVSGSYFNGGKRVSSSQSIDGYSSGYTGGYGSTNQLSQSHVSEYGARDQSVGGAYGATGGYETNSGYGASGSYGSRGYGAGSGYGVGGGYTAGSGYGSSSQIKQTHVSSGYGAPVDETGRLVIGADCKLPACDETVFQNLGTTGGNVKKYGISSSWSSKSQTVNGKTTESKQASVTVNDNGKIDTYSTHN